MSYVTKTMPLLAAFFIVVAAPSTFCPVTSPIGELVYVTDIPSTLVVGATRTQCALECQLSDAIEELRAGQTGCRCFNYNSTSANCSLFMFEPTSYGVDQQVNTIAYQVCGTIMLWTKTFNDCQVTQSCQHAILWTYFLSKLVKPTAVIY
jgi:hypothetical protein